MCLSIIMSLCMCVGVLFVCVYHCLCVLLSVCMFVRLVVASMCVGFQGIDVRSFFVSKWILEPATNSAGRGEQHGGDELRERKRT